MIIHKAAVATGDGLSFVLSDETKDRMGDIIEARGWQLTNFKKNPIALFGHDQSTPIGYWENLRVEGTKLIGQLKLAARGTSQRIDEIISLIEQGILKAVSVGFRPIDQEPLGDGRGIRFKRQELLETSVVSVPANPSALAVAKSLNISAETKALVFGEDAVTDQPIVKRSTGVKADSPPQLRGTPMNSLSKRIEDTQSRLVAYQTELEKHLEALGEEPSEDENTVTKELNEKIEDVQTTLENLVEAEKRLAGSVQRTIETKVDEPRKPWAVPTKKVEPLDYLLRAWSCQIRAYVDEEKSPLQVMKETYGEDIATKAVMDITTKAAVAPADTATSAWAGALVQTGYGDFFRLLLPQSVYPGLSNLGLRLDMDNNGSIVMPTRDATPTVAGSFVGEGSPIPVRRAGFSAITIGPKKMGVITTFTREMAERSVPQIEALLRDAIQEDTATSIDSILLDAIAATTIRPAGIRSGIATAAGTAGGGLTAVSTDIKAMIGALLTATNNNLRNPVWLMNPQQVLALGFIQNNGGDFPFETEVNGGRFKGYPIIQSGNVPAGVVILVDAADFVTVTGDAPRFSVSDQATLHMEDTTPLAIGTAGAPNTVAAPVRSLYQTDTLALRMILPMNWAFRRTGMAVERTAVTW